MTQATRTAGTKRLTPKQVRFVAEYLRDRNATQAAIRAGYSRRTAYAIGVENLRKPEIAQKIEAHEAQLRASDGLSQARVLEALSNICFSTVKGLVRPDNTMKAIHEIDDRTAAAIASFQQVEFVKDGVLHRETKVKLNDKNAALGMAMKHLGLYKLDNEQGLSAAVRMFAEMHRLVSADPLSHQQPVIDPPEQHLHH